MRKIDNKTSQNRLFALLFAQKRFSVLFEEIVILTPFTIDQVPQILTFFAPTHQNEQIIKQTNSCTINYANPCPKTQGNGIPHPTESAPNRPPSATNCRPHIPSRQTNADTLTDNSLTIYEQITQSEKHPTHHTKTQKSITGNCRNLTLLYRSTLRQYNNTKVLKSITGSRSATISAMTEAIATIYTCDSRSLCDNILKN